MLTKISHNILISTALACVIFVFSQALTLNGEEKRLYLAVIIMGVGIGGLGSIYLVKKLPPILQFGIHFGGSLLIFLSFNYYPSRFTYSSQQIFYLISGFCTLFLIIWTISYLKNQRDFAKMNQKINQLRNK